MPIQQSSTALQHWLWQSESWVIWNDGLHNPVFYDATDPNSNFISVSIGNTQQTIGQLTGNTTTTTGVTTSVNIVPAIGSWVLYTIEPATAQQTASNQYVSNYAGKTVLINNQLYYLQSYQTTSSSSGYYPVSLDLVTTSIASGDSINPNTTFYADSNVLGFITGATLGAINSGGSSTNTFPALPVNTYTSATFSTPNTGGGGINGSTEVASGAYEYGNASQLAIVNVGGTIVIGGINCIVQSLTTSGTVTGLVTSITCYPAGGASVPQGSYTVFIPSISVKSNYGNVNTQTLSFTATTGQNMVGAATNYVTLTVSSVAGLTQGTVNGTTGQISGQTISVNSGNATLIVGPIQGSQIQCQMVTGESTAIPINPSSPSGGTQAELVTIIKNANGTAFVNSPTSVFTYPTNNSSGVANSAQSVQSALSLIAAPGASPTQYQIVSATSSQNVVYYFVIQGVGTPNTGTTGSYIYVQNLNDTQGNIIANGTNITTVPELPAGKMGVYGMGRNWMSLPDGRTYMAGDIVGGASGNQLTYQGRDSVLKVSENDMLAGGGSFTVPGNSGFIQAMQFIAQLDVSLGQGPLQVLTSKLVFSCNAPVDRTTWASLTNPIQAVSLAEAGGVSQSAVTQASGDLLFRSYDGQIRSLLLARLDFDRWGNTPVSREMATLIEGENDLLLGYCSSVNFDNRFLLTANPIQAARGVYFPSIIALNFDPYSGMSGKQPAVYDGEWQGTNILQLITGDAFNGGERCFALALDSTLGFIQLVEIMPTVNPVLVLTEDNGITPITSYFESPALFDGGADEGHDQYKRLTYGEIYIDSITSDVQFQIFYLSDQWPDWVPWASFTIDYDGTSDPGFRPRIGLPKPDMNVCDPHNKRPLCEGYTFQVKIQATGYYRFLGGRFRCEAIEQSEYHPPVCNPVTTPMAITPPPPPSLFAGPSPNPIGVCFPPNSASVAFYYTDGASPSLWFWSKIKNTWLPVIVDEVSIATSQFYLQGGQIIIGGVAIPVASPPIPTQPALYYQDNPETQLFAWSVKQQIWLPFITGTAANIAFPIVSTNSSVLRGTSSAPGNAPNPGNAAGLWVQDSPNIQLYAWSVLTQSWFGIIQS